MEHLGALPNLGWGRGTGEESAALVGEAAAAEGMVVVEEEEVEEEGEGVSCTGKAEEEDEQLREGVVEVDGV